MKKFLLLFFCFSTCLIYGQLVWEETNTGTSATISVGEFPVWEMEDPTLNGGELPVGSLIGVFYVGDDGGYYCGGGETWLGEGLIALGPWGDDSTTGAIDGFSEGETFNWFVRVCDSDCWDDLDADGILDSGEVLDGTDYFASSAQMVPSNGQLTGTVYTTNALAGLLSANFTEYVEGEEEVEDLTCECSYGMAIPNGDLCFIFNACSDPLSNNYCEGLGSDFTTYFQEACEYDTAIEGCTCPEAVNYDETASVDDGTCYVVDGGCSDSLADNYSGSECTTATFLEENCEYSGCICPEAYNYDTSATIDDGSCWVLSGGCSDPTANNYSGDLCVGSNYAAEECQYTPIDVDLVWEYDITDGNMTVQIGADVVTFNGEEPPIGSLIGAFFINDDGEYSCGGYLEWTGDQLALAVWAAESGYDNGFETGEEIIWALSIAGEDFLANSSEMNSTAPFTTTFVSNGFGQLLSAVFEGELTSILGCTDSTAFNYNDQATVDDGSCYTLDFDYTVTDGNMTIQVASSAIQFNGEEPPCGSLLGGFYTNDSGQLICGGYQVWCDDFSNEQLAVPLFASESGLDNGFETGEEITWILSVYGQSFLAESVTMNPTPPFSTTFIANGFGQLLVGLFSGEIDGVLGCTNESADNFNPEATIDDGSCTIPGCTDSTACNYDSLAITDDDSCYYEIIWYYDLDGDGLGSDIYTSVGCESPGPEFVDNNEDLCPTSDLNDQNDNGICDADEVLGCMNVNATNYDISVNVDDGSCIIPGCTDPTALNYSEEATEDNGTCIAVIEGCMDSTAFNYSEEANTDDDSCCYIAGCIDSTAFNYNLNACFDDGSCIAIIEGCTDPSSFNYNNQANVDDGSCQPYIFGCMDSTACNYDDTVNTDNSTCVYPEEYYDCDENCLVDSDGDGVCDALEILGCVDSEAFNYNPAATDDDGSCIAVIEGCMDSTAFNYSEQANTDDDSCCYITGCTDTAAWNYSNLACFDDGSCEPFVYGCTDSSAFNYSEDANTDDGSCEAYVYGCMDLEACNYDVSVNTDNGSCSYPEEYYDCDNNCLNDIDGDGTCDELEIGGCTNPVALNYNPAATDDDFCLFPGCLDTEACNYDPEGFYYELVSCDYDSCAGCTDATADNYNPEALIDDGSCIIPGCTDATACNYNPSSTDDDGSCYNNDLGCGCDESAAEEGYDCDGICLVDTDGDGVCDEFEVLGCTDITACNYVENATDDDGSCYNNDLGCGCDESAAEEGYDCDGICLVDTDGDGVCDEFEILGCTDSIACNYDNNATDDDASCEYAIEGYDCDGNELELDSPWGNNDGCDPFNNHTVAFTVDGLNIGDFVGLFYTDDNGDIVFSQAVEYVGDDFYFTVCGDDTTTDEKDGFDDGESFIWQLWPLGEDCAYTIEVEYETTQPSLGEYEQNGISQVISFSGTSLSAEILVTDALCNGDFGSAELTVTGGTAPYETDDLSILSAGSYSTIVTDANGCTVTLDFEVTEPSLLEATISVTDVLCNGDFGSAELTVTGGTAPYETDDLSILSAGSYSTIVTDTNGCTVTLDFEVTEPSLLEATVSVTDALCNGDFGSAELTVTGGTAPYEIDDLSTLLAGSYNTIVTDANGCIVTLDFEVVEPELLEVSVVVNDILCNGDLGSAELIVTGGTAPYETDDLSDLEGGTYTTMVIDANGCESSVDFVITEPDPIEVIVTTTDVTCNGESNGSVSVEITGGTGDYDYELQTEDAFNISPNNYSMMFDGDDYITIPADQLPTTERTVSLWFKTDVIGEVPNFGNTLLGYGGTANNVAGATSWLMSVGTCGNGNNAFQVQSHWSVNQVLYDYGNENYNSDWHHWSITTSPSGTVFYLDGVQVAQSDVFISNTNVEGKDLIIGGTVDPSGNGIFEDSCAGAWVGQLDDVQIWDYALSESEIQQYINCSPNGSELGLVGYWNFEEGPDQGEVLDLTGNATSGIITGATYTEAFTQNCIDSELVFVDDLDDLSAGDYVITTLDSNGCFDITEFSISEPEELSLTFETTPGEYSNCASGTASVFVDGGTLGYEYLWSNGEVTSEITGLCGGDYSVVVTDSNGCEIEGVVTVEYVVPEGWEVVETDLIHTIDIPLNVIMLLDQVDLVSGDYVGVFFDNEDGTQSCGGYVMLVGESTQILAYGNDGVNDGFEQGEQFNWKMWNSVTETTINGFAVYDESYSDERYFNTGGESGLLGTVFATYQLIPLNENPYSDWDMISTYMSTDETVESIFSPVLDDLIIIKDANGLVYWPLWDIISLNTMSTDDAYAIKTWSPNELLVYGDFIQPEEISFQLSGWNYISYPRYFPEEVDVALSSVLGNIKLLKDDSGNIYWPELGMNTIGQMEAGEGYVLKVMGDQTFNYPSNSDNVVAVDGGTTAGRIGLTQPVYYSDFQKTNKNMVVGLPLENWNNFDIEYGDEIAVLDNEGNIVGVSVLEVDNNVLVIWGDDESSLEKDGMLNGEKLNFELWKSSSNTLYNVSFEWTEGTDNYASNGINLASSIIVEEKYENNFEFISCYPNPTSGEFSLEFNLNNEDNITISIFNSIGERVYRLNNKSFTSGLHSLPISLSHLGQGLYYIELQSQEKYQNVILDLTK